MNVLLTSTLAVALAEIGDKTQLLALVLASRYRRPWPILAGITVATALNHALAGLVGAQLAAWLGPVWLRWIVGLGFVAMGLWMAVPDALDEDAGPPPGRGPFAATLVAFFLAEMGDKTQIATVALAAANPGLTAWVVAGTTLGLLLANGPVVFLGDRIGAAVDLSKVRYAAAALFVGLGVWTLL
jgi:Ca2+/H+ antiporter, TMEM165/GDT1 family